MEEEKQENLFDKLGINFHRKLSFKIIPIGILVLLLLIPRVMILSLVEERSNTAGETIDEVMSKWSNSQIVTGPVLTLPYKTTVYNANKKTYSTIIQSATFLPKQLHINGLIKPEKLYRSIYDVVVFRSEINISGTFEDLDFNGLNISPEDVMWKKAEVKILISDLRGINKEVKMNWEGEELIFAPSLTTNLNQENGISLVVPKFANKQTNNFNLNLELKGSKSLLFTPVGEKTEVEITSSWNAPGFIGNFLPTKRKINDTGFEAEWDVLHFNRNYPQQWINKNDSNGIPANLLHNSDFGVELISVANHYQKNTRSAKYAILIIIIIFVVFFMHEVFTRERIHPFQYLMVGFAITLFYLLLLSISEHLGFNLAYFLSALAVLILIVLYSRTFMQKLKNSIGLGFELTACFAFVFVLLQLESFALLAGSVGMFILLAMLMFATRKVNWYKE